MALLVSWTSSGNMITLLFTYNRNMPSTNILAYPIDSVTNIVNSIKEDKIGERAKFCIPLQAEGFVWLVCPIIWLTSEWTVDRLSVYTSAQRKSVRSDRKVHAGSKGWGLGFAIQRSHKNRRKQSAVNSVRPKVIITKSPSRYHYLGSRGQKFSQQQKVISRQLILID